MEVYKRKDGRSPFWQYDITLPDGSRQRCSTRERDKGKARRVMLEALGTAKAVAEAPKASPTLWGAVDAYLNSLKADGKAWHRNAATIRNRIFGVEQFEGLGRYALPKSLCISEITDVRLLSLRAARRQEGLSQGSIGHELKVIRAAVFLAGERPAVKWQVPPASSKLRWLTPEEWAAIFAELDPHRLIPVNRSGSNSAFPPCPRMVEERQQARDLFVALTLTGGRWGEVTRLTTDTILSGGRVRLYGRKTGKERIVPLPVLAAEAMDRRVATAKAAGTPFLFAAGRQGPGSEPRGFQAGSGAIKRAFERSGVNAPHKVERDGKATIHSLRHTFASWCLQNGLTLSEVQEILGHGSIAMTQRYAHLATGVAVERATAVMDRVVQVFA